MFPFQPAGWNRPIYQCFKHSLSLFHSPGCLAAALPKAAHSQPSLARIMMNLLWSHPDEWQLALPVYTLPRAGPRWRYCRLGHSKIYRRSTLSWRLSSPFSQITAERGRRVIGAAGEWLHCCCFELWGWITPECATKEVTESLFQSLFIVLDCASNCRFPNQVDRF